MIKVKIIWLVLVLLITTSVEAHIKVKYPQGGEEFSVGEVVTIEWEVVIEHNTLNYNLMFSEDDGETWQVIKSDISADSLLYQWTVPDTETSVGRIKVIQVNEDIDYEAFSNNFTIGTPTSVNNFKEEKNIRLYPNPMKEYSFLEFEETPAESFTFLLFDLQGKVIREKSGIRANTYIDRKSLKSGFYFYKITNNKDTDVIGKILVR